MWPSTCPSTVIRDRRPTSTGLSHRWRPVRPNRVAAAKDAPQRGVNVRAKRREGFARASHKASSLAADPGDLVARALGILSENNVKSAKPHLIGLPGWTQPNGVRRT